MHHSPPFPSISTRPPSPPPVEPGLSLPHPSGPFAPPLTNQAGSITLLLPFTWGFVISNPTRRTTHTPSVPPSPLGSLLPFPYNSLYVPLLKRPSLPTSPRASQAVKHLILSSFLDTIPSNLLQSPSSLSCFPLPAPPPPLFP